MASNLTDEAIAVRTCELVVALVSRPEPMTSATTLDDLGLDSLEAVQLSIDIATAFNLGPFTIEPEWGVDATVAEVIIDTTNAIRGEP